MFLAFLSAEKSASPSGETGAQVVNKNHGDTFPRENTRWEEEEIVVCVQVLTTCSGKQWWCPNCKVGLCIEGCFSRYNTCLNYEEYNRHIFVLEGNVGFQCTCTMYIQCTVYCIMSDILLNTFIVFFLLNS